MSRWRAEYFCTECEHTMEWAVKMRGDGVCPYCGLTVEGTVASTYKVASKVGTAWTITKLKWVRWLLKPLLRLHIWLELKGRGQ